jgi:2,4-dichlorophenol 6-monooxygenase
MRARSLKFSELNVEYGYGYNSAAVVPDGTPAPVQLDDIRIYEPSTRPGAPLPHGWIDDEDGNRRPIKDLVIPGRFLLIAGENGQAWCDAARDSLPRPELPLDALRIGHLDGGLYDPRCVWVRQRQIAPDGAILLRPDRSLRGDTRPRPRTRGRRSRLRSARSSCIPPRHPSARRCEACDERSRKTSDDRSPGWLSE